MVNVLKPNVFRLEITRTLYFYDVQQARVSSLYEEYDEEDLLEPEGADYKRRDALAKIPSAEDVMYKRRQHMPGYPK